MVPRFGIAVPTATEGMMYPVPFADARQAVELAVVAEQLGYDSVWGNDHLSTQAYVRAEFDQPPSFFDPLGYLAYVAARTERIRLATCVLVLPFRHPVVAAKQLATLDQLSGGRMVAGVGIGAYREELEALHPGVKLHRGNYAEEAIRSLNLLFTERRASFEGELIRFSDVESYPKPLQPNLPILSGGNGAGSKDRAGRLADGWLPACLTPAEVSAGRKQIDEAARTVGRELPATFEVALQLGVSVAPTRAEAEERFRSSQVYAHLESLAGSTLKDQRDGDLIGRNLVGTPDDVADQIRAYVDAGVSTFAGLLFASDTVDENIRAMELFSTEVMSRYSTDGSENP